MAVKSSLTVAAVQAASVFLDRETTREGIDKGPQGVLASESVKGCDGDE